MSEYLAAQRYARALSEAIADSDQLDETLAWITEFVALINSNAELRAALTSPSIRLAERTAVLDHVLKRSEASPLLSSFLREVLRRGRIQNLQEIARVFRRRVDERLKRTTAQVTTARPVSDEHADRLQEGLSTYTGKTVRIKRTVDPEIIGGVVVKVDGTIIDGSLKARLQLLRDAIIAEEN
mgnify:CR=1 FL=1